MATTTVNTLAALLAAIVGSASGDIIKVSPGIYGRFYWPKNTNYVLTITAADPAAPPTFRGIWAGDNADVWFTYNQTGAQAATVNKVIFDNLKFVCERITSVQQANGSHVSTIAGDGQGWGWRADYSYPGGGPRLGQGQGFVGLKVGGTDDVTIKNCTFDGFGTQISAGGSLRCTIIHNDFLALVEDGIKFFGATNLKIYWNSFRDPRGITFNAANAAYGWNPNDGKPPHMDFIQGAMTSAGQTITTCDIYYNYMIDLTGRVHGILMQSAYVGASPDARMNLRFKNVTISNNKLFVTNASAILLNTIDNLHLVHNKVYRPLVPAGVSAGDTDVRVSVGANPNLGQGYTMSNVYIQDNVVRKFWQDTFVDRPDYHVSDNVIANDATTLPGVWTEIDKALVAPGHEYAGRGGDPGGPAPVTQPDPLTTGQVTMFGTARDPDFPLPDDRETGVLKIPTTSPAFANTLVKWSYPGSSGSTLPVVSVGTDGDGGKLYRLDSGSDIHLKHPEATFSGIKVHYTTSAKPDLSNASTVTLSFTVPAAPAGPVPTQVMNPNGTFAVWFEGEEMGEYWFRGEQWWKKPAPLFLGGKSAVSLTPPQPNIPVAYGAGDFLLSDCLKTGSPGLTKPAPGFWTERLNLVNVAGLSMCLVTGFATGPAVTLGSFTGASGRCVSLSYRNVNPTTPVAAIAHSDNTTNAANVICPALTLTGLDNLTLLLGLHHQLSGSVTVPAGYVQREGQSGPPKIAWLQKLSPHKGNFAGLTVALPGSSGKSIGVSLALQLDPASV